MNIPEKDQSYRLWTLILTALLVLGGLCAVNAQTYPFPQRSFYDRGIAIDTADDSSAIQALYENWMSKYYEQSGAQARIKFDNPAYTVSEGIGYGMLIMVYMDNDVNNTRPRFDRLWNYYKYWSSDENHKVMHWKIEGFTDVNKEGGATDAELDVALALAMAFQQWQDSSYFYAAQELIAKILLWETDHLDLFQPGDGWNSRKNPSYFSMAAIPIFAKIDAIAADRWQRIRSAGWDYLATSQHSGSGLHPDWTNPDGSALEDCLQLSYGCQDFGYDAIRTPWRMVWSWLWHGDAEAAPLLTRFNDWAKSEHSSLSEVKDGYTIDGTPTGTSMTGAFLGAFITAGMQQTDQAWIKELWYKLRIASPGDGYFSQTLQILYALLATGNMPDFWKNDAGSSLQAPKPDFGWWNGSLPTTVTVYDDQGNSGSSEAQILSSNSDSVFFSSTLTSAEEETGKSGAILWFTDDQSPVPAVRLADTLKLTLKGTASCPLRISLLQDNTTPDSSWHYDLNTTGSVQNIRIPLDTTALSHWKNGYSLEVDLKNATGVGFVFQSPTDMNCSLKVSSLGVSGYSAGTTPAAESWHSLLVYGSTAWYPYEDNQGSNSTPVSDAFPNMSDGSASATLTTVSGVSYQYAGIGYNLTPDNAQVLDLSNRDKLHVRARFDAGEVVTVEFKQADRTLLLSSNYYAAEITGTGSMEDYVIHFSDLKQGWFDEEDAAIPFKPGKLIGLQLANKMSGESMQIKVEDIRVSGASAPDFSWKPAPAQQSPFVQRSLDLNVRPAWDGTTFWVYNPQSLNCTVEIFDLSGRKVLQAHTAQSTASWQLDLPRGAYLYRIRSRNLSRQGMFEFLPE